MHCQTLKNRQTRRQIRYLSTRRQSSSCLRIDRLRKFCQLVEYQTINQIIYDIIVKRY